ncbi:MAG: site-specific integrase [Candidatus Acidiferrales bacterium]
MRGAGRIFKRPNSSAYWIAYSHRGKEVRESVDKHLRTSGIARAATKNDAERLLKLRLRQVGADLLGARLFVGPQQERVLADELLDALETDLTLRQARSLPALKSHLKRIRAAFGDRRAIDISAGAVDRYVESRLSQGAANATINRETGLLAQAFKLGVERQSISAAPRIRKLSEKGNARQGFFEKADFDEMVKYLPDYLEGFVQFGYYSGWRRGEIRSLQWADVDLTAKVIRLRPENSKTREGRVLALEGKLWSVIAEQHVAREYENLDKTIGVSRYVFHHKGEPIGDIRKSWNAACKQAHVEGKIFHDLRRTAVRNMIRAGVPERLAMAISGHRTRAVFDRYNIVFEDDLRIAVEKTNVYLSAAPKQRVTMFPGRKRAAAK